MSDRIQKTIQQYNKIASGYSLNISSRYPKKEMEYFANLLKPNDKVLDVGCAAGRDCRIFKDKGLVVIGIDLSEKLIEIAQENNPDIEFEIADIRKIPFSSGLFCGLWVNAVFHHLDKKGMIPTLKEFRRVLKTNGILFIRTKLGEGNWKVRENLALNEEREFTLLNPVELKSMVSKVGFKIINLYTRKDKTRELYWINLFCSKTF